MKKILIQMYFSHTERQIYRNICDSFKYGFMTYLKLL